MFFKIFVIVVWPWSFSFSVVCFGYWFLVIFGEKFVSAMSVGAVAMLILSAVGAIATVIVLFHVSVISVKL